MSRNQLWGGWQLAPFPMCDQQQAFGGAHLRAPKMFLSSIHTHGLFCPQAKDRWMTPPSPSQQAIMEKIHARLVKEYIVRLLKRKVSLKTPAQQQNLAQHISKNAADLEAFCTSNVRECSLLPQEHGAWAH